MFHGSEASQAAMLQEHCTNQLQMITSHDTLTVCWQTKSSACCVLSNGGQDHAAVTPTVTLTLFTVMNDLSTISLPLHILHDTKEAAGFASILL